MRAFQRIVVVAMFVAILTAIPFGQASAGPKNDVRQEPVSSKEMTPAAVDIDAMSVCSASGSEAAPGDWLPPEINLQLSKLSNRMAGQDLSGQDLSGKDIRGKVLVRMTLRNTRLRGADLSGAIVCGSDLTGADLTGAHLDHALIAGGTILDGIDLTGASARNLKIADASYADIRIDRADLRGASIICQGDLSRCLGQGGSFATMTGADLRGATIDHLWAAVPGLETAHLAGLSTQLDASFQNNYAALAHGVGLTGRMTFFPGYGYSGARADFSGRELAELKTAVAQLEQVSPRPSFDCARARIPVEKAICSDAKLAALDAALNWLWDRAGHTAEQTAVQKKWLATRTKCPALGQNLPAGETFDAFLRPESFSSPANPDGCIGMAYARRIRELAPQSPSGTVEGGTYTTDAPLELPRGKVSPLAQKLLRARGYRQDEIALKNWGGGAGSISGEGVWANGHMCGFLASEADTKRAGSRVQVFDDASSQDEQYSVSFVVTPQVIIWVGGAKQFQCGARGGWSMAYFRQPNTFFSTVTRSAREAN